MPSPRTLFFLMFFILAGFTYSRGQETVKIRRIEGTIAFDGRPDEEAWSGASPFQLTMHKPDNGSAPSQKTEVMICYDDESVWIGARLFMDNVSKINYVSKKRDEEFFGFDAFGVIIDTYNDNENGLAFFTAPTGIRVDYTISNDAVTKGPMGMRSILNFSWNTFWDVKTTHDEKGWYVEMRIPFSSLKFKPDGDVSTMGLIISRSIGSNTEMDTYPAIRPDYGYFSPYKPSQAASVSFEGVKPKRPVYISPYILGGYSSDYLLNETETKYTKDNKPDYNAGLDVKYNINSNLTLDLTANTDFSQVESDILQVNMTRYNLFYPEKRKFFQERTSLFDFSLGGQFDNLFYSRTIGIANGVPTKIYGGARITGRMGKTDIGFLEMQTGAADTLPSENFGVLRLRKQVINQNSYVGGIITTRIGANGHQNIAYGLDGLIRIIGEDYLNIKWAQTYDNSLKNNMVSLKPSFILLDWERRSQKGFAYKFDYNYYGEQFNPASGFMMRGDVQGAFGKVLYGWIPGNESRLLNYNISLSAEQYNRLSDGKIESGRIFPGLQMITKKGFFYNLSLQIQKEGVREDFNRSDSVVISARDYSFTTLMLWAGTPGSKKISVMGNLGAGQFYDGRGVSTMTNLIYNISSSFNINLAYTFNAIFFPHKTTNNTLYIHSLNLTALIMLSTKFSATIMTQYSNTEKDLITNFRIRYNPKEGNDLYLVYNDYRGMGRWTNLTDAPPYLSKILTVKYVHTFRL